MDQSNGMYKDRNVYLQYEETESNSYIDIYIYRGRKRKQHSISINNFQMSLWYRDQMKTTLLMQSS